MVKNFTKQHYLGAINNALVTFFTVPAAKVYVIQGLTLVSHPTATTGVGDFRARVGATGVMVPYWTYTITAGRQFFQFPGRVVIGAGGSADVLPATAGLGYVAMWGYIFDA